MAGTERYTVQQVIEAIRQGHTPTGAAGVLHCHADTVRNYAERYPTVRKALDSERKGIVEIAEMGLRGAVLRQEPWAVTFALRTLGKDEGYSERLDLRLEFRREAERIAKEYDLTVEEVMAEAQQIVKAAVNGS